MFSSLLQRQQWGVKLIIDFEGKTLLVSDSGPPVVRMSPFPLRNDSGWVLLINGFIYSNIFVCGNSSYVTPCDRS